MALLPRCIGRCRDGSQCSRRVVNAANPQAPLCHLHDGRDPVSPIIPPPDEVDEMKILKRLARSSDQRISLRAVDLLLTLQQKEDKKDDQCPRCATRRESADVYRRFTDEQMEESRALFQRWHAIKTAALTQPIHPGADYV
jgi:hypothetical protein